jgi:hypothetical protein
VQRLKSGYGNDQMDELRDFSMQAEAEFNRLSDEYAQHGKATATDGGRA